MMRKIVACLLCLIATDASAQYMRDQSLSVEDTMREPDISYSSNPTSTWQNQSGQMGEPGLADQPLPGEYRDDDYAREGARFMDSYCDPNFRPLVPVRVGMASCFESIKQKACDGFARLPAEVQGPMNRLVECQYNVAEEPSEYADETRCARLEHEQMRLLKHYWRDQNTAYTILFLPDLVINAGSFCTGGGRQ